MTLDQWLVEIFIQICSSTSLNNYCKDCERARRPRPLKRDIHSVLLVGVRNVSSSSKQRPVCHEAAVRIQLTSSVNRAARFLILTCV